jgi:hypothetical protein
MISIHVPFMIAFGFLEKFANGRTDTAINDREDDIAPNRQYRSL